MARDRRLDCCKTFISGFYSQAMKHRPLPRRLVSAKQYEDGSFRLSSDLSIEALAKLEARRRMEAKAGPPTVARSEAKSEGWSAPAFLPTMNFVPNRSSALPGNIRLRHRLTRNIKIRAAHEIMAARAAQLALFVDQLMTALRTISPVLAGDVFVERRGADTGFVHGRFGLRV
jgi:hypothetical protein